MTSPSLSNSTKATKAYGGIREEEQRREHQILQDVEPKGFPHKVGILIGESVDLDLGEIWRTWCYLLCSSSLIPPYAFVALVEFESE